MKKTTIGFCALVLAVIVTSFSVSGTYAKYVGEAEFSDYGRVAKWGIDLSTSANFNQTVNLFKQQYTGVSSNGGDDVIAPGSYGNYQFELKATGTPEVDYKVSATVTVKDNISKLKFAVIDSESKPLDNTGNQLKEGEFSEGTFENYNLTASELATVLKTLLIGENADSKEYAANEANGLKAGTYTIYWMWQFENGDEENAKDTELGNGKTSDEAPKGKYEKDFTQKVTEDEENTAAAYINVKLTVEQISQKS